MYDSQMNHIGHTSAANQPTNRTDNKDTHLQYDTPTHMRTKYCSTQARMCSIYTGVYSYPGGGGGGGGGTSICMHIGYVPRERPPFSALNFRSGAYHFHKLLKSRSGASPFYIFWRILPFRRPSFSKFL